MRKMELLATKGGVTADKDPDTTKGKRLGKVFAQQRNFCSIKGEHRGGIDRKIVLQCG